jgi:hypothetical protein
MEASLDGGRSWGKAGGEEGLSQYGQSLRALVLNCPEILGSSQRPHLMPPSVTLLHRH